MTTPSFSVRRPIIQESSRTLTLGGISIPNTIDMNDNEILAYNNETNEFEAATTISIQEVRLEDTVITRGDVDIQDVVPFPQSILSFYNFTAPDLISMDTSGNGRHGKNINVGYAASLDGETDIGVFNADEQAYIDISSTIETYTALTQLTISVWVRLYSVISPISSVFSFTKQGDVITDPIGLDTRDFILFVFQTRFVFQLRDRNDDIKFRLYTNDPISINTWYHITCVMDAVDGAKLYLNGVEQNGYVSNIINDRNATVSDFEFNTSSIGATKYSDADRFFLKGQLKNLMFVSGVLSQSTITDLANDTIGYDVYVLAGQSNMVGNADIEVGVDDNYSLIEGKVFQYPYDLNDSGSPSEPALTGTLITPATNPLDFNSDTDPGVGGEEIGKSGLWKTFAETLVPLLRGRKILLIPVAKSATSFSGGNWNQGDPVYTGAVQATNQAMSLNDFNVLKGILWCQGESDAIALSTTYTADLTNMYNGFRADILSFSSTTLFLCISIVERTPVYTAINAELEQFATTSDTILYIDGSDLTYGDPLHYDIESLRTLGIRAATAFPQVAERTIPTIRVEPSTQPHPYCIISNPLVYSGSSVSHGYVLVCDERGGAYWVNLYASSFLDSNKVLCSLGGENLAVPLTADIFEPIVFDTVLESINTLVLTNSTIQVSVSGLYFLTFSASFSGSTSDIQHSLVVDNEPHPILSSTVTPSTTSAIAVSSFSGILRLDTSSNVEVHVKSAVSETLTYTNTGFSIYKM